jgi:hypothetical protein
MFEQEADFLVRDLKAVEGSYGTDILLLTVLCRYVQRLLERPRLEPDAQPVVSWMRAPRYAIHAEIFCTDCAPAEE